MLPVQPPGLCKDFSKLWQRHRTDLTGINVREAGRVARAVACWR